MMVLVTYDVNTETAQGKKRLRKVAKQCEDYGQRVQNSVFECIIDPALLKQLQNNLEKIIDKDKDSIRYYYLGNEWKKRVEHVGAKISIDMEGTLIV
jgi:CRISPR-associated protein Cas2